MQLSKNPTGGCTYPAQPSPTFDFQGFLGHQCSKTRVRKKHHLGRYLLVRSQCGSKWMTALGTKRKYAVPRFYRASSQAIEDSTDYGWLGTGFHLPIGLWHETPPMSSPAIPMSSRGMVMKSCGKPVTS